MPGDMVEGSSPSHMSVLAVTFKLGIGKFILSPSPPLMKLNQRPWNSLYPTLQNSFTDGVYRIEDPLNFLTKVRNIWKQMFDVGNLFSESIRLNVWADFITSGKMEYKKSSSLSR